MATRLVLARADLGRCTARHTLALIKASPNNEHEAAVRTAVDWLNARRSGNGQWGNTQATILGDFYETRPREVILYWRALAPSAKQDVDLDLLAAVPGSYEAPASSAYLYYTAEDKAWAPAVKVTVTVNK